MNKLNMYLISADTDGCLDCYDAAVVVAYNEEQATYVHPDEAKWNGKVWIGDHSGESYNHFLQSWVTPDKVTVKLLGVADEKYTKSQMILGSYIEG